MVSLKLELKFAPLYGLRPGPSGKKDLPSPVILDPLGNMNQKNNHHPK